MSTLYGRNQGQMRNYQQVPAQERLYRFMEGPQVGKMTQQQRDGWQNVSAEKNQSMGNRQLNSSSPSLNIHQLSNDLMKLKEQLKKLAERGQELGSSRLKNEETPVNRGPILQSPQNSFQGDGFPSRRMEDNKSTSATNFHSRPNPPTTQVFNFSNRAVPVRSTLQPQPPSKRSKIDSFMVSKEDKARVVPAVNITKETVNSGGDTDRIKAELRLELEVKELKQKVSFLEKELGISRLQKENMAIQVKSIKSKYEALKEESQRAKNNSSTKSISIEQSILRENEREQQKANVIIQKLQAEINQLKSTSYSHNQASFDEVLKSLLEQNKALRLKVDQSNEEIKSLKDRLSVQAKNYDSLKHELVTQQMKTSTQLRSKQQKLSIQLNDKCNQLQTAKRAMQTLQLKYRAAVKEIAQKDEFIMNFIVSRSKDSEKEDIKQLLQKYTISFPQNRTMQNLISEQKQIEDLKKEIAQLSTKK